jgi:hypothetical protein
MLFFIFAWKDPVGPQRLKPAENYQKNKFKYTICRYPGSAYGSNNKI